MLDQPSAKDCNYVLTYSSKKKEAGLAGEEKERVQGAEYEV